MTTIAWKSGSSSAGPQQVIFSLCTINQPQTLAINEDKHDTAKPGEKTGSAHLQQLGSNLELLLQVSHRPLHIEDRLLMLQELLPTMVQGQVYLLQVLDFPLKFQRKQISGHRGREGASGPLVLPGPLSPPGAFCLALPAQPLGYCFPLAGSGGPIWKQERHWGTYAPNAWHTEWAQLIPAHTSRVGHCPASLTPLIIKPSQDLGNTFCCCSLAT